MTKRDGAGAGGGEVLRAAAVFRSQEAKVLEEKNAEQATAKAWAAYEQLKNKIEAMEDTGREPKQVDVDDLQELRATWKLAKDRYDNLINPKGKVASSGGAGGKVANVSLGRTFSSSSGGSKRRRTSEVSELLSEDDNEYER